MTKLANAVEAHINKYIEQTSKLGMYMTVRSSLGNYIEIGRTIGLPEGFDIEALCQDTCAELEELMAEIDELKEASIDSHRHSHDIVDLMRMCYYGYVSAVLRRRWADWVENIIKSSDSSCTYIRFNNPYFK